MNALSKPQDLAVNVYDILKNPACPDQLRDAINNALAEIQSRKDCYNVDFLTGLFQSQPREAAQEDAEGK
jgi:hypothetical protein